MSGVNQITIVGHVGSAPDLRYTQDGKPYCVFSVAVNEQWKSGEEKKERVTWFPVVAWNGLSEVCANFVDRGRLLCVQGRVRTRKYEDKAGTQHHVMQVVAERVTFLGAKRDDSDGQSPAPGKPPTNQKGKREASDEDAPF